MLSHCVQADQKRAHKYYHTVCRLISVSNSLPVSTNIKMIEVFMLLCLILCFLDILLQTYIHYIKKEKPTKKEGEDDDDEEEEEEVDEVRLTLADMARQLKANGRVDWLGENKKQQQLTKEEIFDMAMAPQAPSSKMGKEATEAR